MRPIAIKSQVLVALLAFMVVHSVRTQFLQPQSHLGRLVQSIAQGSPIVLGAQESDYPESSVETDASSSYSGPDANYHYVPQNEELRVAAPVGGAKKLGSQQAGLQQAPSQQRGIPQKPAAYGRTPEPDDDRFDHGHAPSNRRPSQEYQMGAYLGPTMDDKEMNGIFNEDREEEPNAGYDDDSPMPVRKQAASSNHYPNEEIESSGPAGGYGGTGYGPGPAHSHRGYGPSAHRPSSGYDEDSVDEDDVPAMRGGRVPQGRGRSPSRGLNQAASHYRQQRQNNRSGYTPAQLMVAAANGYSPYTGYATGPVDLTPMLNGADPASYNSYPGQSYYNQQGNRNQAASMANNGYAGSANDGYSQAGNQVARQQASADRGGRRGNSEDFDSDADED